MRILVVEDDTRMVGLLRQGLTDDRHIVDCAENGPDGLEKARQRRYDVIVLDIMLPGMDGLGVMRCLRNAGVSTPVLMLTGRDSVADVVRGLDSGADDYLTKPFSFEILRARLRVLGRRSETEPREMLEVADLTINTVNRQVRRSGRLIPLTKTEYLLLEVLAKRAGRVVPRDVLTEAAWQEDRGMNSNTLEVFIFQLRTKLESGGAPRLLQTVRGFGYTLRETEAS
jgi:DNA-binding response OmpR family regulator